ncbi:MAG: hypothetical protein EOM74_03675 [Methanomicrobia archaeon]|nr:hypothetical protein [Methanomicrobia archaeon]
MGVYDYLNKHRHRRFIRQTDDNVFFQKNRFLFEKYPYFNKYFLVKDDFAIIKANAILHSLINKIVIEEEVYRLIQASELQYKKVVGTFLIKELEATLKDLPYIEERKQRIYVPLFSRSMNLIYHQETEKLAVYPYNDLRENFESVLIDPFEVYSFELYQSNFTKLIEIKGDATSKAYYHMDFRTIYIINQQGRLDLKIPLFDRGMRKFSANHIMERIEPVIDAFYQGDKARFTRLLRQNKLISERAYRKITGQPWYHLKREVGEDLT